MALRVWKTEELTPLQAQVGAVGCGVRGVGGAGMVTMGRQVGRAEVVSWAACRQHSRVGPEQAAPCLQLLPHLLPFVPLLCTLQVRLPNHSLHLLVPHHLTDAAAQGHLYRHPHLCGQARAGGAQGHD